MKTKKSDRDTLVPGQLITWAQYDRVGFTWISASHDKEMKKRKSSLYPRYGDIMMILGVFFHDQYNSSVLVSH
jgi:hypothetical protein